MEGSEFHQTERLLVFYLATFFYLARLAPRDRLILGSSKALAPPFWLTLASTGQPGCRGEFTHPFLTYSSRLNWLFPLNFTLILFQVFTGVNCYKLAMFAEMGDTIHGWLRQYGTSAKRNVLQRHLPPCRSSEIDEHTSLGRSRKVDSLSADPWAFVGIWKTSANGSGGVIIHSPAMLLLGT